MVDNYVMLDLDDPKIASVADVISNKTCKKILELLAEKELSESEIASNLKLPLNTIGYNIKKLVESGLVEKTKSVFWSVKGKKIPTYKISNKKIVISPKKFSKSLIISVLGSGLAALGIKAFYDFNQIGIIEDSVSSGEGAMIAVKEGADLVYGSAPTAASYCSDIINCTSHNWAWFLLGALFSVLIYLLVDNWRVTK